MATLPKWQEPLVERAGRADQTLRAVLLAPDGMGEGALLAAAAADRDLAELCREFAERTTSPLLKQLLVNGGRALAAEADFLAGLARDDDPIVVVADVPVPARRPLVDDHRASVDEDQALTDATPEPALSSGDAVANEPVAEQPQASLDDVDEHQAVPVGEPSAEVVDDPAVHEPVADAVDAAAEMRWLNTAYSEARERFREALAVRPLPVKVPPHAGKAAAELVALLRQARESGLFTGLAAWAIEDACTYFDQFAGSAP